MGLPCDLYMPEGPRFALPVSMINAFVTTNTTWAFLGLLLGLMITSIALFWSIEDQRAKRRIPKD